MKNSADLLDVNVWLALVAQAHSHHQRAGAYWEKEAAACSAFCRVTQLGFLRHLTNKTEVPFFAPRDFGCKNFICNALASIL